MVSWIASFTDAYQSLTTVWPVIYAASNWWAKCTGNYAGFAADDPLWIASNGTTAGTLPAGWSTFTFWQYASRAPSRATRTSSTAPAASCCG